MTKQQVVAKITELIDAIEAIISGRRKQATEAAELRQCTDDLRKLLDDVRGPGKSVDPAAVLLVMYKTTERVHAWVAGKR